MLLDRLTKVEGDQLGAYFLGVQPFDSCIVPINFVNQVLNLANDPLPRDCSAGLVLHHDVFSGVVVGLYQSPHFRDQIGYLHAGTKCVAERSCDVPSQGDGVAKFRTDFEKCHHIAIAYSGREALGVQ